MRIGIYDRFLTTLGGGERYLLKMAEVLQEVGEVEIVSQQLVDPETIRRRLGIETGEMSFRRLPDHSIEAAEQASEKYDLFINGSHRDPVTSLARTSVLLVYFPSRTTTGWRRFVKQSLLAKTMCPALRIPRLVSGFGPLESDGVNSFRWTSGRGVLSVPVPKGASPPELVVPLASFRHDGTGPTVRFTSGMREILVVDVPPGMTFVPVRVTPTEWRDDGYEICIESDTFTPPSASNDPRKLGVAVGSIRPAGVAGTTCDQLLGRVRPGLVDALLMRETHRTPAFVESYDSVWSISRFVELWTRKYWNVASSVINPPVDVERIHARGRIPKENVILSVGRFFAGSHNKKHLEMIRAFREMLAGGLRGWTLVLAGGTSEDPVHRDYLGSVRTMAEGLPIEIHSDISYSELLDLYDRASIYWHATGLGEHPRRDPGAMEHFGITTVEAMAAGCVPVVINQAGQRETVRHGVDGLLWKDLGGLTEETWKVILDPALRARFAASAPERSTYFSNTAFARRLLDLLKTLPSLAR